MTCENNMNSTGLIFLVFINKGVVFFLNIAIFICLSIVCDWFHATRAELNICNRDHMTCKAPNIYYLALYNKACQALLDVQK